MPPANPTPAAYFAGIIDLLCRIVAAQIAGRRLSGPVILLIWGRLHRLGVRFARLAARVSAGRLPAARRRRHRTVAPRPAQPAPPPLPRNFGWLVRLAPEAGAGAAQLRHLLATPEMAALLTAAPQAGRILRPLCRMLGVRPPPILVRSKPPATVPAAPEPEAAPVRPPQATPRPRPRSRQQSPPPPVAPGSLGACGPSISA